MFVRKFDKQFAVSPKIKLGNRLKWTKLICKSFN